MIPSASKLKTLSNEEQKDVLTELFEKSPQLVDLVMDIVRNGSYESYDQLIQLIWLRLKSLLQSNPEGERIYAIIGAHPRLGAKKSEINSNHSASEQAAIQKQTESEALVLSQLNNQYEKQYPGLRYVVFVNGQSREIIMENMKMRIKRNDIQLEKYDSLKAMCDIALDRASKATFNK